MIFVFRLGGDYYGWAIGVAFVCDNEFVGFHIGLWWRVLEIGFEK
jgi:hypothetical protein